MIIAAFDPIDPLLAHLKKDADRVIDTDGREVSVARAPGRLDVMGGIADYTGSFVCQMPLHVGVAVAVQRRDDRRLVLATYTPTTTHRDDRIEISLDDLYGTASLLPVEALRAMFLGRRHWAAGIAGAFWALARHRKLNRRAPGANIAVFSSLPAGGGVGGSAALEIAALTALTSAYHLILDPMETAVLGQHARNQIVGVPSGVMDPVTSMMGQAEKLLLLLCQPHTITGYLSIPDAVRLVGINLAGAGEAGHGDSLAYHRARVAADMAQAVIVRAYKDLGVRSDPTKGYLANVPLDIYHRYFRPILPKNIRGRDFLSRWGAIADRATAIEPEIQYAVRAAADHHVMENHRARAFVDCLRRAPDAKALHRAGRLMLASHAGMTHRAGLGSGAADKLVRRLMALGHAHDIYGARVAAAGGAAGGATVTILCGQGDKARAALQRVLRECAAETGMTPLLLESSSPGAVESGAQKIPAAQIAPPASPNKGTQ